MICANCRLIFQQTLKFGPYEDEDEDEDEDDWSSTESTCSIESTCNHYTKRPSYEYMTTYEYSISYGDFLLAATKCHCCHVILSTSEPSLRSGRIPDWEALRFRLKWSSINPMTSIRDGELQISVSFGDGKRRLFSTANFETPMLRWFRNAGEHDDVRLRDAISDTPINSTGSAYTARFVKNCLERCKSYHTKCQTDSEAAPWYPTRLVEVLDGGGARLIETSETTPTGPYTTLSHCWGASCIFSTTMANINSLKEQIPLLDLPKTFRDALQFTKSIGISYIWIDSICIIQDSVKDWEFESRTMLQVYRSAECNLAATVSEDSHGGLFSERDHAILPSGWIKAENNAPDLTGLLCVVPLPDRLVRLAENAWLPQYWRHAFTKEVGSSRLVSRGWVYQERAASKRVVAFGRDQVFWDCSERLESDVLPGYHISLGSWAFGDRFESNKSLEMAIPKHSTPAIPRTIDALDDGFEAWQWIVKRYSACDFTFPKDRPVAILGVAEMMSNVMRNEPHSISMSYWAGLWLQDMNRQLLWIPARPTPYKSDHAPSWSWLSIEGPVEWDWPDDYDPWLDHDSHVVSPLGTIARPATQAVDSDPTFCDLSAELKIWCSLHAVHIPAQNSRRGQKFVYRAQAGDEDAYYKVHCDCDNIRLFEQSEIDKHTCSPNLAFKEQMNCQLYSVRFDSEDIDTENLFFLPLSFVLEPRHRVGGIIIQPAGHQPGAYRRCGRARVSPPWAIHEWSDHEEDNVGYRPVGETDPWFIPTFEPVRQSPSDVDFVYEKYDAELGYLIHLV